MTEPAFFIKSLQLYEITHELTVSLYPASSMKSKKTPGSTFQELAEIVRIDGLLSEWEETVPQQLIVKVAESNGATPLREAVILRLRYASPTLIGSSVLIIIILGCYTREYCSCAQRWH